MEKILEIAAQIDRPLALGGFVAAALFFILRRILTLDIFESVGARGTWRVVKLMIDRLFVLALVAMVFGFVAYLTMAFMSQPMSVTQGFGSDPKLGAAEDHHRDPELTSQVFNRHIGNGGSCTEDNVSRTFDLCLEPGFAVTDWTERTLSGRNSSYSVDRHESLLNCVKLTLRYSDYGRGPIGDCRGHGNINMEVTVNGRR